MSTSINNSHGQTADKNSLRYLDGLRGICCFLVLIEHCINFYKPDVRFTEMTGLGGVIRRVVSSTPLNIVYSGDMAVYIFFVLSGFVLSLSFNKTRKHEYIFSGVVKRYPRIMLPVAASMLFMYIVMELTDAFIGKAFGAEFLNILYQVAYRIPFSHTILTNYPLWSISYEMFGSFLVFSLLAIFGKSNFRFIFYFLVMIYFFISLDKAHQDIYEYSTYYALFVFGVMLCDITNGGDIKINPIIRLSLFLCGLLLATTPLPRENVSQYIGAYSYLKVFSEFNYMQVSINAGVIGSMMLFTSILGSAISIKVLTTKVIMFLGKISFPLYLTHATVIYVISFILHRDYKEIGMVEFMISTALSVAISVPLAYVFEKYVDAPSIKIASKISNMVKARDIGRY